MMNQNQLIGTNAYQYYILTDRSEHLHFENYGVHMTRYPVMTRALSMAGRPIFFSLCEW